jgi:hypothetical protein
MSERMGAPVQALPYVRHATGQSTTGAKAQDGAPYYWK